MTSSDLLRGVDALDLIDADEFAELWQDCRHLSLPAIAPPLEVVRSWAHSEHKAESHHVGVYTLREGTWLVAAALLVQRSGTSTWQLAAADIPHVSSFVGRDEYRVRLVHLITSVCLLGRIVVRDDPAWKLVTSPMLAEMKQWQVGTSEVLLASVLTPERTPAHRTPQHLTPSNGLGKTYAGTRDPSCVQWLVNQRRLSMIVQGEVPLIADAATRLLQRWVESDRSLRLSCMSDAYGFIAACLASELSGTYIVLLSECLPSARCFAQEFATCIVNDAQLLDCVSIRVNGLPQVVAKELPSRPGPLTQGRALSLALRKSKRSAPLRELRDKSHAAFTKAARIGVRQTMVRLRYRMLRTFVKASPTEMRIYCYPISKLPSVAVPQLASRDSAADLIQYRSEHDQPDDIHTFLKEVERRLEIGHHVYTRVIDGVLAHYGWLDPHVKRAYSQETGQFWTPPENATLLYDFFTGLEFRGRGLYAASLHQMLMDAFAVPETTQVYIIVDASNFPSRKVIERVGFEYVESLIGTPAVISDGD